MECIRKSERSSLGLTLLAFAIALWACTAPGQNDERLWIQAGINGKPARLAFDTGTGPLVLFPEAAKRFGLKFSKAPNDIRLDPGKVPCGTTEECELAIGESTIRTTFNVVEIPSMLALSEDGLIGWQSIKGEILCINTFAGVVNHTTAPQETATWAKLALRTNCDNLQMEVARLGEEAVNNLRGYGFCWRVKLSPEQWRDWKRANADQPVTLSALYTPATGLAVTEEAWANKLSLGSLDLTEVPVAESGKVDIDIGGEGYAATLGLTALKRMDCIIDSQRGIAYLRPKITAAPPYRHNRLGAVFTPFDMQSEELIAHVAEKAPASEAGIRDEDLLLKIDELDVTKWRTNPSVLPVSRFWERPAGTKFKLSLKRGLQTIGATVVLRDILASKPQRL
jgi:hypothetical protein